ncbi:DNA cytosine methyltransferase [Streptomyces platensis]|uniref:DNA cytosine methyltransferase n=1 Tax=Streptomyces platensis TaxID=58346 RepID=UPI0033EEBAA0
MIPGEPPCQGFSGLEKENPDDPRSQLWRQHFRVAEKVTPKIFVIENVDRFSTPQEFETLRAEFKEAGYEICEELLNAADFGVAQARKRTMIIDTRTDLPMVVHPRATHGRPEQPQIPDPRTERNAQLSFTTPAAPNEGSGAREWVALADCLKHVTPRATSTDLPVVTAHDTPRWCAPHSKSRIPGI